MSEGMGQVLDYLGYKNKIRTLEWEERLWRLHLNGNPPDFRAEQDRERYFGLLARLEEARALAQRLHRRRTAHAPRFAPATGTSN
jgi:hypothetical protein